MTNPMAHRANWSHPLRARALNVTVIEKPLSPKTWVIARTNFASFITQSPQLSTRKRPHGVLPSSEHFVSTVPGRWLQETILEIDG